MLVADLNRRLDAVNCRWEQLPGFVTAQCPGLVDICPAFSKVKRVAFMYDGWLDSRWGPDRLPYIQRLGLQHLWPHNIPALKEIYLLDHSIRLLPGVQAPPQSTPTFPGYGGTYFEVDSNRRDTWNVMDAEEESLVEVFHCAADLQNKYDKVHSPVVVKVLACVPHCRQWKS